MSVRYQAQSQGHSWDTDTADNSYSPDLALPTQSGGNGLISGLVVNNLPPPVLTTSSGVTQVTISGAESISLYGTTILSWETGLGHTCQEA